MMPGRAGPQLSGEKLGHGAHGTRDHKGFSAKSSECSPVFLG